MIRTREEVDAAMEEFFRDVDTRSPVYPYLKAVYPVFMHVLNEHARPIKSVDDIGAFLGPCVGVAVYIMATGLCSVLVHTHDDDTRQAIVNSACAAFDMQMEMMLNSNNHQLVGDNIGKTKGTA